MLPGPFNDIFIPSFMKLKDPYETRIEVKSKIGSRMESLFLLAIKWEIIESIDNS